jgi:hypothetical protein
MSAANRRVSLTGTNSYSGGTFVSNDAMLAVNADNNLGATSGALTLGNGTTGGVLRIDQTDSPLPPAASFWQAQQADPLPTSSPLMSPAAQQVSAAILAAAATWT